MTKFFAILFAICSGFAIGNLYWAQPLLVQIMNTFGLPAANGGLLVTATQIGYAKLNINLNPGNYVITTVCGEYVNSNSITVLSRLCANDLEMSLRDGSQFLLKLLDDNGNRLSAKNVTFNINGVFYNRLTDSNGIAHLNINLGEGNYIITSKYGDMAISNTVRISSQPISDPHQMVNPIVRRAVFNALNDTDIKIVSFDITYDMNHRANLCDLNGNHIGFLTVTEDGKIVQ